MEITEEFLMGLLVEAGAARSCFMEAIQQAKKGTFSKAENSTLQGKKHLAEVHKQQTQLIGYDEGEGKVTMTLLLTHIQDHIMTAMLCQDLSIEIIEIHKALKDK